MAKELVATFYDGSVYEGFASSYTKSGTVTYYFEVDRRYRFTVNDTGEIVSQEYQSNDLAWYPILLIESARITEIGGGSGGGVSEEWVRNNFYTKNQTDTRYVKKSGDTMTGPLVMEWSRNRIELRSDEGLRIQSKTTKKFTLADAFGYNANKYDEDSSVTYTTAKIGWEGITATGSNKDRVLKIDSIGRIDVSADKAVNVDVEGNMNINLNPNDISPENRLTLIAPNITYNTDAGSAQWANIFKLLDHYTYGEDMLNALNDVVGLMQTDIINLKTHPTLTPTYHYKKFAGTTFTPGGGGTRGGGVGRQH